MATITRGRDASQKQHDLIARLVRERDTSCLSQREWQSITANGGEFLTSNGASRIIDALLKAPRKGSTPGAPAPTGGDRPATDRQRDYLKRLLSERVPSPEVAAIIKAAPREGTRVLLTAKQASTLIDLLQAAERRPADEAGPEAAVTPGMYRRDGVVYRVVVSRTSGSLYAKRLDLTTGSFDYDPGAIRSLTPADRMTLEEAAALGHQHGRCCVCGALLTDPKSVAAGIGPVCAKRV